MLHGVAALVGDGDAIGVAKPLRDHEPIDAIGGEIFHVSVEQARAFAVENSVAIADDRADGGTSPVERVLADSGWSGTEIGGSNEMLATEVDLIRRRKLIDRNLVLIG